MNYLSICSGIEAASVAWHPLGWKPLAFSEIEPFPRAVLAHHYPDVPLYGDFTKLRDDPFIRDADVLVGGTPCQAFSVAGLRRSLDDDRGNLSLEFVRLADAIDNFRLGAGKQPAIVVWENVPGVLSVKDNAFGCFLAGLAGDVAPYDPPRGKWTDAGVVDGPQRTVAWRVLDAQYFGLAQRRRRVFVVASAREGFDPSAVLLEWEGMRRDSAPSREAGQGTAHATAPCFTSSGRGVERTGDTRGQDPVVAVKWPADIAPTLNAAFGEKQGLEDQHALGGAGLFVPGPIFASDVEANAAFSADPALTLNATHEQPYIAAPADICGTLTARGVTSLGAPEVDGGQFVPMVAAAITAAMGGSPTGHNREDNFIVAHTLKGEGFDASEDGTGRGTPLVPVTVGSLTAGHGGSSGHQYRQKGNEESLVPVAFPANLSGTQCAASEDISPSMGAKKPTAIAYPINTQIALRHQALGERTGMGIGDSDDPAFTLQAGHSYAVAVAFSAKDHGADAVADLSPTLRAGGADKSHANSGNWMAVAYAFQPRIARNGRGDMGEVVNALNAQSGETGKGDAAPCVATSMAVRRLTPVECERLQGFPDGYTAIPWRGKPAADCPDGPRYKALGNSMAVPVMRWIGQRIVEHIHKEEA